VKNVLSIFKREVTSYFTQPTAYAVIVIYLLLVMLLTFTWGGFFERDDASLIESFFVYNPWLFCLFVPAVGMRLWSDEQRNGTIELLGTLPLSTWSAIFGKFAAAGFVWLLALVGTLPIWVSINLLGSPDNLTVFSGYLGSYLVCLSFLAITMLVSAFTRDQVVCLIVSIAICFTMVIIGFDNVTIKLSQVIRGDLLEAIVAAGVWDHFNSLIRGSFRLQDFVWFATVIFCSLLGTSAVLSSRRS